MTTEELSVTKARSALSRLFVYGRQPAPDAEATARASLATAKMDRAIRQAMQVSPRLNDAQVGHLVGLLLSLNGAGGDVAMALEAAARSAIARRDGAR